VRFWPVSTHHTRPWNHEVVCNDVLDGYEGELSLFFLSLAWLFTQCSREHNKYWQTKGNHARTEEISPTSGPQQVSWIPKEPQNNPSRSAFTWHSQSIPISSWWYHHTSLVGGFNPSEKYEISWDDYSQYIKKQKMFQTTNQSCFNQGKIPKLSYKMLVIQKSPPSYVSWWYCIELLRYRP
jgi:hypothetical protein